MVPLVAVAVAAWVASPPIANVTQIAEGVLMPAVSMGHSDSSSATSITPTEMATLSAL